MSRRGSSKPPPPDGDPSGFDVDAVLQAKPSYGLLLRRGFAKRCPRCGGAHLFRGWFRMAQRCPTCGFQFEREPGFVVGVYLINFAITEGFLFILIMVFIVWKAGHPDAGLTLPLSIGMSIGLAGPIFFYPYARTIWSAIDLAMTPLELAEIVAAADAVDASAGPAVPPGDPDTPPSDAGPRRPDDPRDGAGGLRS